MASRCERWTPFPCSSSVRRIQIKVSLLSLVLSGPRQVYLRVLISRMGLTTRRPRFKLELAVISPVRNHRQSSHIQANATKLFRSACRRLGGASQAMHSPPADDTPPHPLTSLSLHSAGFFVTPSCRVPPYVFEALLKLHFGPTRVIAKPHVYRRSTSSASPPSAYLYETTRDLFAPVDHRSTYLNILTPLIAMRDGFPWLYPERDHERALLPTSQVHEFPPERAIVGMCQRAIGVGVFEKAKRRRLLMPYDPDGGIGRCCTLRCSYNQMLKYWQFYTYHSLVQ